MILKRCWETSTWNASNKEEAYASFIELPLLSIMLRITTSGDYPLEVGCEGPLKVVSLNVDNAEVMDDPLELWWGPSGRCFCQ